MSPVAVATVAMVFFLLRDISIMLFLNLGRFPNRADMLTLIFLALLYGVVPKILATLGLNQLTGLLWPVPGTPASILMPAAVFQAVAMFWLLGHRWRNRQQHYEALRRRQSNEPS
jgi:hypothetical protein